MRSAVLRWAVAWIVVIGMIAQAAALVRHNGAMIGQLQAGISSAEALTADPAVAALMADLKQAICHPGALGADGSGGSNSPKPGSTQDCPVCSGLVCAYGLPAVVAITLPTDSQSIDVGFPPVDQRVTRHRFLRPASRGPPSIA
jgi:hypothetical protein